MTDLSPTEFGRVAVLLGGNSAEREISLKSGQAVFNALKQAGVNVTAVDPEDNMLGAIQALDVDRVFNVLHGRGGEDGQVQALLSLRGIPFTGCDMTASALTMDKLLTKQLLKADGIPTPPFVVIRSGNDLAQVEAELSLPVFVKPTLEGSSLGMSRVDTWEELPAAVDLAAQFGEVFVEQGVEGTEITAGYLEPEVLPLIRLETPHVFYDYDAKYFADDTRYLCPCGLTADKIEEINGIVSATIQATGVRHWGRVDLMLDAAERPYVIEVNTVPGMTDHSLVPMAAAELGIDFQQLCLRILAMTL